MKSFVLSAFIGALLALAISLTTKRPIWRTIGILIFSGGVVLWLQSDFSSDWLWSMEGFVVAGIGILAGYCIFIALQHVVPPKAWTSGRPFQAHDWWLGAALVSLFFLGLLTPHLDRLIRNLTGFTAGGIELQFGDSVKTTEMLLVEDERDYRTELAFAFARDLHIPIKWEIGFLRLQHGEAGPPKEIQERIDLFERTAGLISKVTEPLNPCMNEAAATKLDMNLARGALREPINALTRVALQGPPRTGVDVNARHAEIYGQILTARNQLARYLGEGGDCTIIEAADEHIWPGTAPKPYELVDSPFLYTFLGYLNVYVENIDKAIDLLNSHADHFSEDPNFNKILYELYYYRRSDFSTYQKYTRRALNAAERQCRLTACQSEIATEEINRAHSWLMNPTFEELRWVAEGRVRIVQNFLALGMGQALAAGEEGADGYEDFALAYSQQSVENLNASPWLNSLPINIREAIKASFYDTRAFVLMTFQMQKEEPSRLKVKSARDALSQAQFHLERSLDEDPESDLASRQQRFIRVHTKRLRALERRL